MLTLFGGRHSVIITYW